LGKESQGDMASLMARYGSQLAIAHGAGSISGSTGAEQPASRGPYTLGPTVGKA
jgi:hypothetical protein